MSDTFTFEQAKEAPKKFSFDEAKPVDVLPKPTGPTVSQDYLNKQRLLTNLPPMLTGRFAPSGKDNDAPSLKEALLGPIGGPLPRPSDKLTSAQFAAKPWYGKGLILAGDVGANVLDAARTPAMLALGPILGRAAPVVQRVVSLAFAGQMTKEAAQRAGELTTELKSPHPDQKKVIQLSSDLLTDAGFGGLAGLHAASSHPPVPTTEADRFPLGQPGRIAFPQRQTETPPRPPGVQDAPLQWMEAEQLKRQAVPSARLLPNATRAAAEALQRKGAPNASPVPSAESVPELEIRPQVGGEAPLRQQGPPAGAQAQEGQAGKVGKQAEVPLKAQEASPPVTPPSSQAQPIKVAPEPSHRPGERVQIPLGLSLDDELAKLKVDTKGKVFDAMQGIPVAVWNGSIDAVRLSLKAGKQIGEALKAGLDWIRENHPQLMGQFDEKEWANKISQAKQRFSMADDVDSAREGAFARISPEQLNDPHALGKLLTQNAAESGSVKRSASRRITLLQKGDQLVAVSTYRDEGRTLLAHPELTGDRISKSLPKILADGWQPVASVLLKKPISGFRRKFASVKDFEDATAFPVEQQTVTQSAEVEAEVESGYEGLDEMRHAVPMAPVQEGPRTVTEERAAILRDFFSKHDTLEKAAEGISSDPRAASVREALHAAADDLQAQDPELSRREALLRALKETYEKAKQGTPLGDRESETQAGGERAPETTAHEATEETSEEGPGLIGTGAATPSEFPEAPGPVAEATAGIVNQFRKIGNTVAALQKQRSTKNAVEIAFDEARNHSNLWARRQTNDVRGKLRRSLADKSKEKQAQDALSFWSEAGGNEDTLRQMADKIQTSKVANPKWAKRALDAITYALYHQEEMRDAGQEYRTKLDAQLAAERLAGFETPFRPNYVPHYQDVVNLDDFLTDERSGGGSRSFEKGRTHDTFADSIAKGIDPESLNATDLLEARLQRGQRMVNSDAWIDAQKSTIDPQTGKPLMQEPIHRTRENGKGWDEAPPGYSLQQMGNRMIAVHSGYEGLFSSLTKPSWMMSGLGKRLVMRANAVGKTGRLMVDTYHLGRVALWQSVLKGLNLKAPVPSYKMGKTLLDYTPEEIQRMADAGELTQDEAKALVVKQPKYRLAVKTGFNIGRISDALHNEWVQALPLVGQFNRFVFDSYQRSAMMELWDLEYERISKARPELSETERGRIVSSDLNTRFGNLGARSVIRSRTGQDLSRMVFLAPQWNEGIIRSELGAVLQAGKVITDLAQGKRIYTGILLRAVGGYALLTFVVNQMINMITRGKPTWENPEPGIGAKLSAWIPDGKGGPGLFIHPLAGPAEFAYGIIRNYEKKHNILDPLNTWVRNHLSYSAKPLYTLMTQQDNFGRPLPANQLPTQLVKDLLPTPIGFESASKAILGNSDYPGQTVKETAGRFGVKLEVAPTSENQIRSLADQWRSNNPDPAVRDAWQRQQAMKFPASAYAPLRTALKNKNKQAFDSALADLRKIRTDDQIDQTMQRHVYFSGTKKNEPSFKATLDKDGLAAYEQAVADRKAQYQQWLLFSGRRQ